MWRLWQCLLEDELLLELLELLELDDVSEDVPLDVPLDVDEEVDEEVEEEVEEEVDEEVEDDVDDEVSSQTLHCPQHKISGSSSPPWTSWYSWASWRRRPSRFFTNVFLEYFFLPLQKRRHTFVYLFVASSSASFLSSYSMMEWRSIRLFNILFTI